MITMSHVYSPEFVSMHPAGGELSGNPLIEEPVEWNPDKSKWAQPEGTAPVPTENPLAKQLNDVLHEVDGVKKLHIDMCNKVGLHKCNRSCLKRVKPKSTNSVEDVPTVRVCRHHFGEYDPGTKSSSGKDVHPFHAEVTKGDHPRFEGRRDHPRFLQHIKSKLLSWKANNDTQAIIEPFILALMNYLTQYACKGASSTEDFIDVYRLLIQDLDDSSTVKSLCQRLLMKIAGLVDLPSQAADFINTGGKLVRCTRKFSYVGLSGYRMIDTPGTGEDITKKSTLDKFLSPERRALNPEISLYEWAKECRQCNCRCLHVPVFTGAMIHPVWPPTEDFSKTALMRYKKGTWTRVDDLKDGHNSFIESFANYLDSEECIPIVKELMDEAKANYDKKTRRIYQSNVDSSQGAQPPPNSQDGQVSSQLSQMSSLPPSQSSDLDLHPMNYREMIMHDMYNNDTEEIDPDLEAILNTGGDDFDWVQYTGIILNNLEFEIPVNGNTWVEEINETAQDSLLEYIHQLNLPEINVLLANHLQMVAISMIMKQLYQVRIGENPEQLLMLLVGTAGTGKTYIMTVVSRLTRRLFGRNGAVMNVAPTGAASVLLPDGKTIHSVTPMLPRSKKRDYDTCQITDYPMNDIQQRKLRQYTGNKDERIVQYLGSDERSMIAGDTYCIQSARYSEATLDDRPFGGIPVVSSSGDHGQLGPVNAKDIFMKPTDKSNLKKQGYALYRQFDKVIVLSETMRQAPDQIKLLETLLRIRRGEITQQDWLLMNSRYEGALTSTEKMNFEHDRVITLCETWKDVNVENRKKLNALGTPVAVIPSISVGYHAQGRAASTFVGQIPSSVLLAVGSRIVLTKNQLGLTGHKLNNGAMGIIIAIVYEDEAEVEDKKSPPDFPKYVIVDFPKYTGPAWIEEKPTWIPIAPQQGFCDNRCCSRTGFPLLPGYSMTIAKAQGCTIGANELVTHMRLKLQEKSSFECLCPGLTYTGLSRVDKNSSWALVDKIDFSRLAGINTHSAVVARRDEDERLKKLHTETLKQHNITKRQFIQLLTEIDRLCNDDINDAICQSANANCSCIACSAD